MKDLLLGAVIFLTVGCGIAEGAIEWLFTALGM